MIWETLILFLCIFFWGSPFGVSFFFGHLGAVIISLSSLRGISKNYLFWTLIIITILTATEQRFSLEYIFLAMTFFYLGTSSKWTEGSEEGFIKRRKILFFIFLILAVFNIFKINFSEKGSLLLWLPIYLSLYYKGINKSNFLVYVLFGSFLFFSNKFTTLIAFIVSLRSKLLYALSSVAVIGYCIFKHNIGNFLEKSFEPRIHIWKSALKGFLDKFLFGHGFGTFSLDFPEYRTHAKILGGRVSEHVIHGHSLFSHFSFELGLVGIILIIILFYLVVMNAQSAFVPLLVISLFDAPLVSFSQYLVLGLLIIPFIKDKGILKNISINSNNKLLNNLLFIVSLALASYIFIPSMLGHYFYSKNNLDSAIKWDAKHSLYYFTRGAKNLNKDPIKSEIDFKKATELSPSVSYFYGFLGAAELANNKLDEAKVTLEKAMKLDGKDGYWCLLYAYANYNSKPIFNDYLNKAFKKNPEIKPLLKNPRISAKRKIGYTRHGDIRLAGFYRRGESIYFPLPILD